LVNSLLYFHIINLIQLAILFGDRRASPPERRQSAGVLERPATWFYGANTWEQCERRVKYQRRHWSCSSPCLQFSRLTLRSTRVV